jgi:hypothetical protein
VPLRRLLLSLLIKACAMNAPRKYATKTRGRPFQPGNAGKPKGERHKATLAAEALRDGEAEALTRKAVELAKAGDTGALRLCLERILPARKDRPVSFAMSTIESASDAATALSAVMAAVASGEVTPREAAEIASLVEIFVRTLETNEFERRLLALGKALSAEEK